MPNELSFALGLNTGNFLKNIVLADAALNGLKAMASGVADVFRKVEEQLDRARGLEALSRRTGVAVGTLYQLQEGFKAVELSSDALPNVILRLQRALSGMDETGQSTLGTFAKLGLNIRTLAGMDAASQLRAIGEALVRLPKEQATGAASKLFGRFGAGDILQIARSSGTFNATLADAARDAALYERVARGAERVHEAWMATERAIDAAWTYVAEGLLPAIERIEKKVRSVPWELWGQKVGGFLFALEKLFESGDLSRMLTLSLQIGFEEAIPYGVAFARGLGAASMETMKVVAIAVGELFGSQIVNNVVDNARMIGPKLAVASANKNIESYSNQAVAAAKAGDFDRAKWLRHLIGVNQADRAAAIGQMDAIEAEHEATRNQIIGDATGKIRHADILGAFTRNFNPDTTDSPETTRKKMELRRLFELSSLDNNLLLAGGAAGAGGATGGRMDLSTSHYRPQFTDLEKMGFVMGMGGTAMNYQRRMADALDRLVALASAPKTSPETDGGQFANVV